MARKTKEEAQATRGRILTVAAELFHEKGYVATSLEDIAEAAAMTRGAIYWHFKNKPDLFAQLHEQIHEGFMARLRDSLASDKDGPLERLKKLSIDILLDFEADQSRRKALGIFFCTDSLPEELQPFIQIRHSREEAALKITAEFFKRAIEKGELAAHKDPPFLAQALFCYVCGIIHERINNPGLMPLHENAEKLISLFFDGVRHGQ
ncbi:MAG: TetR family transcriptional regulator [Micavibrio sp.]